VIGGMTLSNGLAFSPDGRTMYHADTPTQTVMAYDYDEDTGTAGRGRVFAQWTGQTERPDGATVDSVGNYWVSFYSGGKVMQVSPRGRMLAEHPLPALCPTMPAFGGPDLMTLYVTTARQKRDPAELARLPESGGVFAKDAGIAGLPETMFPG
jgi:sugar lactone lactonase YvrE